jgi:hypothetical protein
VAWEVRRGKRVYYRKERYRDAEGRSHVRSIYFGSGERAEAAAREDEERRCGASLAENEPCATSLPSVMQRCNNGNVDVADTLERKAVDAFSCSPESVGEPAPRPAFTSRRVIAAYAPVPS